MLNPSVVPGRLSQAGDAPSCAVDDEFVVFTARVWRVIRVQVVGLYLYAVPALLAAQPLAVVRRAGHQGAHQQLEGTSAAAVHGGLM